MTKKKLILSISLPILALVIAIGLAGGYFSKADSTDFVISNGVLSKYTGTAENVVIPENVTEIGSDAFSGNPYIKTVKFPKKVEKIDSRAFQTCIALESIEIPDTVTKIDSSAFAECKNLKSVKIGTGVTSIGDGIFSSCMNLEKVDVVSGNSAFQYKDGAIYTKDMTGLISYMPGNKNAKYNMPDTVTSISEYAFSGCQHLKELRLSTGISKIPSNAFYNAVSLEHVIINEPTKEIGFTSFKNCTGLKEVELPMSINNIYDNAFDDCKEGVYFRCLDTSYAASYARNRGFNVTSVCTYVLEEDNTNTNSNQSAVSDNNTANNNDGQDTPTNNMSSDAVSSLVQKIAGEPGYDKAQAPANDDSSVMYGNGVIVSDKVFVMTNGMKVTDGKDLGNSQSSGSQPSSSGSGRIDNYQYYNSDMTSYDFSDSSVNTIGTLAFARSDLKSVNIPSNIISIEYGAFYHCDSLEEINIPSSVVSIEAYAFNHTPWYDNWLASGEKFLIVGDGVLYSYNGQDEDLVIPDGVKFIAPAAFSGHSEIKSVTFPDSLKALGDNSFYNTNIETINNLGDNVVTYGNSGLNR
ncbi:MAG TPA: hypothetical protein DCP07_08495 [Lachnospiraceae bacterium]|nr:hypothetical protein [Lachnospiraceae bacterium]